MLHLWFLPTIFIPYFFHTTEWAVGRAIVFLLDDQRLGKFNLSKPLVKRLESKSRQLAAPYTGKYGSGMELWSDHFTLHTATGKQEAGEEDPRCGRYQVSTKEMKAQESGTSGSPSPEQGHRAAWTSALQRGRPQWPFSIHSSPWLYSRPSKYPPPQLVTSYIQWTLNLRGFKANYWLKKKKAEAMQ